MQGRRCSTGCETWPDSNDFAVCPICEEKTKRYRSVEPLDEDEAKGFLNKLHFEQYYVLHCRKNGQSVDGPLLLPPEESLAWSAKYPGGKGDECD